MTTRVCIVLAQRAHMALTAEMPRASLVPCSLPGCGVLVVSGRCPAHQVSRFANQRKTQHTALYHSTAWKRIRRQVLHEEPRCRRCGAIATTVDHIVAVTDGGAPLDRANLQSLCVKHHGSKTQSEIAHRRKR